MILFRMPAGQKKKEIFFFSKGEKMKVKHNPGELI